MKQDGITLAAMIEDHDIKFHAECHFNGRATTTGPLRAREHSLVAI